MTQAVTVYRWDDVGAPQITTGKPSEYLTVFKKCLVEGYGNKISLGWTVAEESAPEDPPYLAVRNNINSGGSGGTMTFESSLDDGPSRIIKAQSFLDFTSRNIKSRSGAYFAFNGASTGEDYMLRNWVLVGTAKGFFFIVSPNIRMVNNYFGTHRHTCFYVGDINSFYPNDPAPFITLSGSSDSYSVNWNGQLNYKLTEHLGSDTSKVYALDDSLLVDKGFITTLFGITAANKSENNNDVPSVRVMTQCLLSCGGYSLGHAPTLNNEVMPYLRGYIPGLFLSQEYGFRSQSMFFVNEIDGQNYLAIPRANDGGTNAWVNLEEW